MKKFSFNMEKILKLRMYAEQEAKLELGKRVGELSEIENNIRLVAQERVRVSASQFSAGNNAQDIQQYTFYIMRLDNTKEELLNDAAKAELAVEEAREIFIEASRERKVLDKLKEKKEAEYKKSYMLEEIKSLDDLAQAARARRIAG